MFETITRFAAYLENITFFTYPVTLFLGFLAGMTALTCCAPIVPAVAGFVIGQGLSRRSFIVIPFFIMLGSIIILVALGVVVFLAGLTLQKTLGQYWTFVIGMVCIIMGLFVLGVLKLPGGISAPKIKQEGFIAAIGFGLVLGGVIGFGSSCCLPALPVVLTYAAIQGRPLHGTLISGTFAIGQSIPLFAIGLFSNLLGKLSARWARYVKLIAGVLLIGAGIYFIWRR